MAGKGIATIESSRIYGPVTHGPEGFSTRFTALASNPTPNRLQHMAFGNTAFTTQSPVLYTACTRSRW